MAIEMAASSNLHDIDDEISAIDAQIEELNRRKRELVSERQRLREREQEVECEKLQSKSWDGNDYAWSASLDECLRSTFGITSYRGAIKLKKFVFFTFGLIFSLTFLTLRICRIIGHLQMSRDQNASGISCCLSCFKPKLRVNFYY